MGRLLGHPVPKLAIKMEKESNIILPESIHGHVFVADLVFKINPIQCSGLAFCKHTCAGSPGCFTWKCWL